jgi:hypothetical protein
MRRNVDVNPEPFKWDFDAWIVIALVIAFGLIIAIVIWPHPFPIPE